MSAGIASFVITLLEDISASWARMLLALVASILFSIVVGILAATSKRLEKIILPTLDVLQTIPILGFFPVVIFVIVSALPGFAGINLAVIFLIFTSMAWNISFGVYEAVKSIPEEIKELGALYHFSFLRKVRRLYIPASMERIAYQSSISWSIGLFYLVTSEIFSTGNQNFAVKYGIGVEIAKIASSGVIALHYVLTIVFLIAAVVLTRYLILNPFSIYAEKFSFKGDVSQLRKSRVLQFYRLVYGKICSLLPKYKFNMDLQLRRREHVEKRGEKQKPKLRNLDLAVLALSIALFAGFVLLYGAEGSELVVLASLAVSFIRVWFTYIIAAAIAVPLSIGIGLSKRAFEPSMELLQILSSLPAPILLPLLVVMLRGTPFFSEEVAITVIFIAMIWYLMYSIISGIRGIPKSMLEMARISGMKLKDRLRKIYIPAMLPAFVTGSITAIGGAWNSLIVAEYFSVQSNGSTTILSSVSIGIGKLIDEAVAAGNLELMVLAIVSMTIMVITINRLFWQRLYNKFTKKYMVSV